MKRNKTVIGITGGVGAGKSRVLDHLKKKYGCALLIADDIGRELMAPGKSVYQALVAHYGQEILLEDGRVDKKKLSALAFENDETQRELNAVEHPVIREEIEKRIEASDARVILLEAALLLEGGLKPLCSEVWYIYAPEKVRLRRLMKSRGYTEEKGRDMIARQKSDAEFRAGADRVVNNFGPFFLTKIRLCRLMRRFL